MDDSSKTEKERPAERQATQPHKAKLKRGSQDITERKKAERALRESEEKYRKLFEEIADPIFVGDAETGIIIDCNRAASKLVGREKAELVGKPQRIVHPPEEIEGGFSGSFKQHLKEKEGQVLETQVITKKGEIKDVAIRANLFELKGEKRIQAMFRDITERKKMEESLRKERDKAQKYLDVAGVMLVAIDAEQRVELINKKGCEILEYKEEEVIGKNWFDNFLPQRIRDEVRAIFKKIILGEIDSTEHFENPILTKNRNERIISWHNTVLRDNGRIIGALSSGEDITECKKAEEQLKVSLKEKEVLISEIHHRVKNNLQVMSSLFKLQSEYIQDKRMLEMLKQSRNRVRAMALIHEKLYQSENVARIDFVDYVRSLAGYLFRLYEVSSDAIALKINAGEVSLGIDSAVPCGLIVSELISNSLKHAFPAEKEGQIRIEFHSDKDNHFTLIISDNGVGLPKAMDFRKAKSLGLQLVNMLTGQLGGAVELDRSDGTTFKITFTEPQE